MVDHTSPDKDLEQAIQSRNSTSSDAANKEREESNSHASESDVEAGFPLAKLDWDSPDDVGNPQNWPVSKKVLHTAIPALYGFAITVATSAYTPAIPIIMRQFQVEREIALLPLSMYTFGFVLGPLVAAPMSELYGRRMVYWATLPLLILFIGISGSANNISLLTVMRLLAGIGGSGALAIGAGTISDVWDRRNAGRAALGFVMAPFLGPALGPLIGAYIIDQYNNNWRYSQWVVLFIAAPVFLISLSMQETMKSRILYLRAKKVTGKAPHREGDTHLLLHKVAAGLTRPFHMMFVEPLVAFLSIYTGFSFAMMFSFFGSYNYVFQSVYGFNQKEVGLTFLGILVGFIFAVISFGIFDATLYARASRRANDNPAPEHRLYAAMLGSIMMPIGLFWFAWAPAKDVHWIVPVLAGVPFGWGSLAIFISATTYLVDVYQAANGASAVAANGILRYLFGSIFPLFTIQMYTALGIHWAGSVFAFVGLVLMPVPWVFFWKGKELRMRSRYDTSKF
ncbi:putative polyamine transporter 4 [Rhexocercosporidium sp. MPI-PUGE-AT-0058]|nr:putative polyamine transporter 4 [Rhexocercosporidium sp. MPI-PUGE-AT-0058]